MKVRDFFSRLIHWETWHYLVKYIPIMPVWLWYCFKSRSLWFFTPSNPTLTFGGFEGESKLEMYAQLPPGTFPSTILIPYKTPFEEVKAIVSASGFTYPLAVKPNVGMMGFMFRTINDASQLKKYNDIMPAAYLVQELVNYPLELSVFYYRFPNQTSGTITGFIKKDLLCVTGDGESTLEELINNYPRAKYRTEELKSKHKSKLGEVISKGEEYILSYALNLSRGGKLISLAHEKDERLLKVFDDLSHYSGHFYYGRYDLKCASIEELKQGKNFSILEYNGCGAEPHHIYGNGNTLLQAYKIVLQHWKVLYSISKHNYERGIRYWEFRRGYNFLKNAKSHFRIMKQLDLNTQL